MATPLVAAAAIQIREYFMKGYYPSGSMNKDDSFVPSGALLKAMLIHSTVSLTASIDKNGASQSIDDSTYPSREAGFGRVQLNRVLNFGKNDNSKEVALFVVGAAYPEESSTNLEDDDVIISYGRYQTSSKNEPPLYVALKSPGASYSFSFNSGDCINENDCSIRVTLAYTDIVGSSGSANLVLNDLDMIITSSNGEEILPPKQYATSPVESIILNPQRKTNYTVTITATTLYSRQSFSLVITGNVYRFQNDEGFLRSVIHLYWWLYGRLGFNTPYVGI